MRCSACGSENEAGRKFCGECGSALSRLCSNCGSPNPPSTKFCGECGSPLSPGAGAGSDPATRPDTAPPAAVAERRLVTVLFADLVGFTTLSETRDAEDVRDLLTRYFDTSSRIVERYGGTVEKFIGDAVMAVWGTPTANEDDAERAVRAALDLTTAVQALGEELGAPNLRARAGLLTGEAAVTLGAKGQGMVAGDLVNTASRIQAAAEPGAVLVGEVTKRATEAAVVYGDAGLHEMKGKAEPAHLWRAERVVGLTRGELKSTGLEAPFVGRDREFALVKELFHASADRGRAHLVSVWGIGGIGKSRLSWEFFKYLDGLASDAWWHRGRCLPYGDGVTYWALAEMVRSRAGIAEGENPETATLKLHAAAEEHLADHEERRWVEPRLAHLLGLEERSTRQPEELFSAWRLFFERLTDKSPVVMVFEDLQWADAALLDFIEYLLEWSRNHPVFVITLARPELADRHPNWGAGKRNLTSLALEPLDPEAMRDLLDGLAPGLPEDVTRSILDRAEGVPLYAVETVRMLVDRGLLARDGATGAYKPTGPIPALEVPETLHALIAARLDGLTPQERTLVQHAAVLGKSFTRAGVTALGGASPEDLQPLLESLQRKEIVALQSDPRSPERGQFGFLQDLVKRVAYETLSKRDRKALHVVAAHHLEREYADEDVVEIVAHHYTEAYQAVPDAPDAPELRARAREALVRAGERARSLAANAEAQTYFDRAVALAEDEVQRATLLERAGQMAMAAGRRDDAKERFENAIGSFTSSGHPRAGARVSAKLAELYWLQYNSLRDAVDLLGPSVEALAEGEDVDEDTAILMAQAARFYYFQADLDSAGVWVDRALAAAEAHVYPWVLSQALNTKALIIEPLGHPEEAMGLLKHALAIAVDHDLTDARLRALFNLANELAIRDRLREALRYDEENYEIAQRMGLRHDTLMARVHLVMNHLYLGEWDRVHELLEETPLPEDRSSDPMAALAHACAVFMFVHQGDVSAAEAMAKDFSPLADPLDMQDRAFLGAITGTVHQAQGRLDEALEDFEGAIQTRTAMGLSGVSRQFASALEVAFELGRRDRVEELLAIVDGTAPSEVMPSLRAQVLRVRAKMAAADGRPEEAEALLRQARAIFGAAEMAFWEAVTTLELAEALAAAGRPQEASPLLAGARATFERLKARPWLERADRALSVVESQPLEADAEAQAAPA